MISSIDINMESNTEEKRKKEIKKLDKELSKIENEQDDIFRRMNERRKLLEKNSTESNFDKK